MINGDTKIVFSDWASPGDADRELSFDEVSFLGSYVSVAAQAGIAEPPTFSLGDFVAFVNKSIRRLKASRVGATPIVIPPSKYFRGIAVFLQRLVSSGFLTEIPSTPRLVDARHLDRLYRATFKLGGEEWARGLGPLAYGIPYVAHVFGDVSVRVHASSAGNEEAIGTGFVPIPNHVVTNSHVVNDADDIHVSWGQRVSGPASVLWKSDTCDLAVLLVDDVQHLPVSWIRAPIVTEPVVVLGYPLVPGVAERPLLRFPGAVVTECPVPMYLASNRPLALITAFMGPGASGSPVYGADGCLVGLVVDALEGTHLKGDDGGAKVLQQSIYHAIIPGDVLLEQLRTNVPALAGLNSWG